MPTNEATRPIRVLIVDDHGLVREGLRAYLELEPDIQVIGEARDGVEGVHRAQELQPDVILMDLVMPNMDGLDATARIREQQPDTRIIILTSFLDDERVVPAIRAGATSYLLKDVAAQDLARAIRGARAGQAQLHPEVARRLMQQVTSPRKPDAGAQLTEREREVLRLLADGRSNKEIARLLVVSERTVKGHVSNILGKLGLQDRTQAALFAVRNGLGQAQ
ncbi:MAG: response regulator transcription factor [Chloroflexi bacterium]|nr:response regulator transcription factor [Chloroflexota bacterium]